LEKMEWDKSFVEGDIKYISMCVLVDSTKNVWVSLVDGGDASFYQVPCGELKLISGERESFEECAIREVREQTGIIVNSKNLKKIIEHRYILVDGLRVCNIFLTCVHDTVPVHESLDDDMWKKFDYRKLDGLDYPLIYPLKLVYNDIERSIRSLRINNRSNMRIRVMDGDIKNGINGKRVYNSDESNDSSKKRVKIVVENV
ncbi:5822_t:CDS:1, partial [Acaulospora morrowiae]